MLKSMNSSEFSHRAMVVAPDPERKSDPGHIQLTPRKNVRFLRLPKVRDITGLSKSSIYARIAEGSFPSSVPLDGHAVGWVEEEVIQWAYDRIAQARTKTTQLRQAAA